MCLFSACDINCVTCKVNTDLSTTCTECYTHTGVRGYYLKKEDATCKSSRPIHLFTIYSMI